jgi:hypothetical protein
MKTKASRNYAVIIILALLAIQCSTIPAIFKKGSGQRPEGFPTFPPIPANMQPNNQQPNNQQPNNQQPNNQQPNNQQPNNQQPNNQQPDNQQPNDQQPNNQPPNNQQPQPPFQPNNQQPNDQQPQPPFQPNNQQPITGGPYEVAGVWDSQTQTQYGIVYSELILEHTGTFSQQVLLGDLMTYDVGTFVLGDGWIHFYVDNHEPKVYKGKDMTWPNSFTYFYTFVDANTINFEDHITNANWTAYRK